MGHLTSRQEPTMGGLLILVDGDSGTLSGLSCQDGELAKWDGVMNGWTCA